MSKPKSRIGGNSPSFCWQCNKQLQRAPGKGLGLFYFHIIRDAAGVDHRIHGGTCLREAIADGNKFIPEGGAA